MDLRVFAVTALLVAIAQADIYLHNMRGSNNRLREKNRNRDNANRLFDSQNNDRGGYNKGGEGTDGDPPMKYMVGSWLALEWTNQHECGQKNTRCDFIIQYMCDDNLRDGESTGTIGKSLSDNDKSKGRHESPEYYANCEGRERNKGLFLADQEPDGNSARYTRQNPGGGRSGLECPEERDYYPYWAPSPWRDIAILTDDTSRCASMKAESQNVKPKAYCSFLTKEALEKGDDNGKQAPLTEAECNAKDKYSYGWTTAPAHGIDAPDCLAAPKSRDNHLGNSGSGNEGSEAVPQTVNYRWQIPNTPAAACALRIRYNITVLDYNPETTFANANVDIGSDYNIPQSESEDRGYVLKNNPNIKPLKDGNDVEDDLALQLAINTAQTGRTFQDRSHKFAIVARDPSIPAAATVHNLNVRGKRGNIVEVYPSVEYDFTPNVLKVAKDDYIHPQWTGSLRNNQNDDGEGRNEEDKSNMITLAPKRYGNANGFSKGYPGSSYPQTLKQERLLGLGEDVALKAAVPRVGDAPDKYFEDPCPAKKRDEMNWDELEDELAEIQIALNDTLNKITYAENHHVRSRRSTLNDELADLTNLASHLDMADNANSKSDEQKDDAEDEVAEIADDDEDVAEVEEANDASPRSRRRRRRRSRSRRRSSGGNNGPAPAVPAVTTKPLVALNQAYACNISRRRRSRRRRVSSTAKIDATLDDSPPYVDLGPLQASTPGTWHYLCTRNNNFSNRSQKGKIIVGATTK